MHAIRLATEATTLLHSPEPVEIPPEQPDWPYPPVPPGPSPIGEPPPETPADLVAGNL